MSGSRFIRAHNPGSGILSDLKAFHKLAFKNLTRVKNQQGSACFSPEVSSANLAIIIMTSRHGTK
jgi:hypothetical protein